MLHIVRNAYALRKGRYSGTVAYMALSLVFFLVALTLLAAYVRGLMAWDKPAARPGPDPMRRVECEISPASWNPPGADAWEFLGAYADRDAAA